MKLTSQEIYDRLINVDKIKTIKGQIRFHLGNVEITVKKKDVVGNILQEWVEGWLDKNKVDHEPNPNTQMPPDIFLCPEDHKKGLLEIKAFNYKCNPGFDIADFKAFVEELIEKPYYLDTDYLIFGYIMEQDTGDVVIKEVWLKKVWEITKTMTNWPITLQYKNGTVNKMRPGNWYTNLKTNPVFASKEDYLAAFEETVYQCQETHAMASQWRNRFKRSYKNYYGVDIDFPRWDDIKGKYGRT